MSKPINLGNKFPLNAGMGLNRVANVDSNVSKTEYIEFLRLTNEHLNGELIHKRVSGNVTINFADNRTYRLILDGNASITVEGLDRYRYGFLIIEPMAFTCDVKGMTKEATMTTEPYNVTLYKFYSPYYNSMELIEKETNMYGINDGEFMDDEYMRGDFTT